ncbi:MAG: hypothetical protein LBK95_02150 [Bifidobacteriaceae bacterium]|nr:hypothetical protein [Bifidobacteriaceae bacterium]
MLLTVVATRARSGIGSGPGGISSGKAGRGLGRAPRGGEGLGAALGGTMPLAWRAGGAASSGEPGVEALAGGRGAVPVGPGARCRRVGLGAVA